MTCHWCITVSNDKLVDSRPTNQSWKTFPFHWKRTPKELKKSEFDIDNENTRDLQITTIKTGYYKWDSLINLNEKLAFLSSPNCGVFDHAGYLQVPQAAKIHMKMKKIKVSNSPNICQQSRNNCVHMQLRNTNMDSGWRWDQCHWSGSSSNSCQLTCKRDS